jgi:hypothetical protein
MNFLQCRFIAIGLSFLLIQSASGQAGWQLQPVPLQTRWAKEVGPDNALKEYPRPQMQRPEWTNLNGLWEYAITKKDADKPQKFDGEILVPFPVESALSGVKKTLLPDESLWYKRTISQPELKNKERLLLHFGAVDWQTTVFVNGKEVGTHTGGYTEFTFDISDLLKNGENELCVKVFDPTDEGLGPHGKQALHPRSIFYTATSGIWQTVWLETVPVQYIQNLTITPNVDSGYVAVTVHAACREAVQFTAGGQKISGLTNELIKLPVKNARLWSPEHPYLYDMDVKTATDEVKSYFGMRKISIAKDEKGVDCIFLNNKPYYNLGVLDQGFWPEGLYTAPTDEALAFDIKAVKAMGFNTIRKHIKVEPARWYYWADKLGVLVWQDMVNPPMNLPEGAKPEFERESANILSQLHDYPCITTWVLFNESWGQYDQKRLTEWIKRTDPSRLVNGHTGEEQYFNGALKTMNPDMWPDADMTDVHSYTDPMLPLKQVGKAQVLGEFGGIGVSIAGHEWNPITGLNYTDHAPNQLEGIYHYMVESLAMLKDEGLSGSIFTQPYDVEGEENGLMTYDREIAKIPVERVRQINELLNPAANQSRVKVTITDADTQDQPEEYARLLDDYRKGKRDPEFLKNLAILAWHVNNKYEAIHIAGNYIRTLTSNQLSREDIGFINQVTKTSHDPGFTVMVAHPELFKQELGEKQYRTAMMNLIYHGDIEVQIMGNENPDWSAIATMVKPYSALGEEILLRVETISYLNKQDWVHYLPVAKTYLDKYSEDIPEQERQTFDNAVKEHTTK